MTDNNKLLLSFYGDDITGSTDAMEALSRVGVRTVLFFDPPPLEDLAQRFGDLQAVGIAGMSRTMTPERMDAVLPDVFERIKRLKLLKAKSKIKIRNPFLFYLSKNL